MSRTSRWLEIIQGTWVQEGVTVDIKQLSHRGTKACIPAHNKKSSCVCSRRVTACFTSASAIKCLPAMRILSGAIGWTSLSTRSGLQGGDFITSQSVWLCGAQFHLSGQPRTSLASNRFAEDADVKQAVIIWLQTQTTTTPRCKPWCNGVTNA